MSASDITTKRCKKCNNEYPATSEYFAVQKDCKGGLRGECRKCVIARVNQWRKDNPDKAKENSKRRSRRYHHRHKDEVNRRHRERRTDPVNKQKEREYKRGYEASHPEVVKAQRKRTLIRHGKEHYQRKSQKPEFHEGNRRRANEWAKANPLKVLERNHRRRVIEMNAEGSHTAQELEELWIEQGAHCAYCGITLYRDIPLDVHVDHIVPLSRGGSDAIVNLVYACGSCNWSKGNKLVAEWNQ